MEKHRIVLVIGLEADQPFGSAGRLAVELALKRLETVARESLAPIVAPEAWGNPSNGNTCVFAQIREERA